MVSELLNREISLLEQHKIEIPLINQLKQIPEITEVVDASGMALLLPQRNGGEFMGGQSCKY